MADDSVDIIEPFEFHPCDSPRGMLYYDVNILKGNPQVQLNDFKRNLIRENEKYLASHPEVRAVVALVTRYIMRTRPRSDLHEYVGQFFSRPKPDIQEEIRKYIEDREPHVYEGDSAVIVREDSSEETSEEHISAVVEEEEVEEEENLENIPRQVLSEILLKAYERLHIDVDDMGDWMPPEDIDESESVVSKVISEILQGSQASSEVDSVVTYLENITPKENITKVESALASEINSPTTEDIQEESKQENMDQPEEQ